MPLYTFVMSYAGETKVHQHRKSNYRGWLGQVVGASYPTLKAHAGVLMPIEPAPVPNLQRVWWASAVIAGQPFHVHIVETRG